MPRHLVLIAILALPAHAGPLDPWYLAYKVEDLIKFVGPFETRGECLVARLSLPIGARVVGCYQ